MTPIELVVEEQPGTECYRVRWRDDSIILANIPEPWLGLIPFMVARKLFEEGTDPDRLLIVRLRGADFDLMCAPLGLAAAPPLLNTKPVTQRAHYPFWDYRNTDVEIKFK